MQSIVAKEKASISSTLIGGITTVLSIILACVMIAMVVVIVTGKNTGNSGTLPINAIQVINGTAMLTRVVRSLPLSKGTLAAIRSIRQIRSRTGLSRQDTTTTPVTPIYESFESMLDITLNAYNAKVPYENQQIQPRLIVVDIIEPIGKSEVDILLVSFRVAYSVYCDFKTCESSRNEFLKTKVFTDPIKYFNSTHTFNYSTATVGLINVETVLTPVQFAEEFYESGDPVLEEFFVRKSSDIGITTMCTTPDLVKLTEYVQQGPVFVRGSLITLTPHPNLPVYLLAKLKTTSSLTIEAVYLEDPTENDCKTLKEVILMCKSRDGCDILEDDTTCTFTEDGKIGISQIVTLVESMNPTYKLVDPGSTEQGVCETS